MSTSRIPQCNSLCKQTLVDKIGKMSDHCLTEQVLPSLRMSMGIAAPTLLGATLHDLDLPPPSYSEASKIPRLSYIDFPPKCTSEGGILTPPTFERFNHLVARANVWLQSHPDVAVRSLETVDYETNAVTFGRTVDTTAVSRFRRSQHGVILLKVLRMWIASRDADDSIGVQQLGYINIIPACIDHGGVTHEPRFESLDVTLDKLNAAFVQKPLPGNVISTERVWMKFRQHCTWIDADRCHFHDRHEIPTCHLYGFRIFYETGLVTPAIIGFQDILPGLTSSMLASGKKSKQVAETFTQLVKKANIWISQNQNLSVTNFQTLHCRFKLPSLPDMNKALTISYRSSDFLQTLRVWFQQFPNQAACDFLPLSLNSRCRDGRLCCRTFCPALRDMTWRSIYVASEYESLADVRKRITDWLLENPDLRVISAETSGLRIDISGTMSDGEDTFVSDSYGDSQSWIRVLRVYYESSSEPEDSEGRSPPTTDAASSSPVASSIVSSCSSASPFVNVSSNGCTIV